MTRGHHMRLRREHEGRAWLAWHVAALPKMKKFPKLSDLLGNAPKRRAQTAGEIEAALRSWHNSMQKGRKP